MKIFRYVTAMAICGAVLFAGCSPTSRPLTKNESLLPEIDVVQVKENSDEALKLAQEAKLDVQTLTTKNTEVDNKLTSLSEEVSSVSIAKIEELENRLSMLIEAFKDQQEQIKALAAAQAMAPGKSAAKKAGAVSTFSPSAAAGVFAATPEYESYQTALRTFNARSYEQAIKQFTEVLNQFPGGAYADNCNYWLGQCFYARADYAQAIAHYQKALAIPNSSKADDAQMQLGICYLKLGQNGLARTELQKLIDRYPASEYVPRAKKYLQTLARQ
jgi:tol-pal system protein YbgF